MNAFPYEIPKPDFGLGPEWQVIWGTIGMNQSLGLKYYSPDGKIYGTYTHAVPNLPPDHLMAWIQNSVHKMKKDILDGLPNYKLQDGVEPHPYKSDISKYDYLLEEK
jgi:hypothetical protein